MGRPKLVGLSPAESKALKAIKDLFHKNKIMPTLREIAERLQLRSQGGVVKLLNGLEAKGELKRVTYCARGIILAGGDTDEEE